MKTKIEKLQEEIRKLEGLQSQCDHKEWYPTEYDPDKEEIREEYVWNQGSHSIISERLTGKYQEVPRWSRVCKRCGYKEYTYNLKTVVSETYDEPDFVNKRRK